MCHQIIIRINYYLRLFNIYFFYYIFAFLNIKYPFWYLSLYCNPNDMIPLLPLKRDIKIQELYKSQDSFKIYNFKQKILKNNNEYVLILNDFPYNISDDILHYVLWIKNDNDHDFKFIQNKIVKLSRKLQLMYNYEFVFSYNIKENKSIQDIVHWHVFIKQIVY